MKEAHYDQKFYQQLFDFILARKRMDMHVWIGHFKEVTQRVFKGTLYDVRAKNAPCNTYACIAGHAAFIDRAVSGTTPGEVIIGRKIVDWYAYSERVFGYNFGDLVGRDNWYEFLGDIEELSSFQNLPKYKQAAMALYFYVQLHFDYILDVPADLQKVATTF